MTSIEAVKAALVQFNENNGRRYFTNVTVTPIETGIFVDFQQGNSGYGLPFPASQLALPNWETLLTEAIIGMLEDRKR
jgi:hypothetical protein